MADLSAENGIIKKIYQQSTAWSASGAHVRLFTQANTQQIWAMPSEITATLFTKSSPWLRFHQSLALCAAVRTWKPDLIYFRYAYHAAGLPKLFREIPTIAELNSDDRREYPLTLGPIRNLYHRLTRRSVLRTISAFVSVTHELTRVTNEFARPVEVIANSIPLAELPHLPPPTSDAHQPRLVFAGSPNTPWHGLDRIAALARLFPEWIFDIIGDDAMSWSEIVSSPPPANLRLHGRLKREQYLPIMAAATAALGTFGLYRKGMHEACPLKVREYLALGLPVIGACADTDIPSGADYYLRLPNNDTPLAPHREAIAAFVEHWRGRRVPREAIAHLDTNVKEATRLAFMVKVASEFRRIPV